MPTAWVFFLFHLMIFIAHAPFAPLQLSKLQQEEQLLGLPPLKGYGPALVRDFQNAHSVLVQNVLMPPSQREELELHNVRAGATS